jgi:hypothetical protein
MSTRPQYAGMRVTNGMKLLLQMKKRCLVYAEREGNSAEHIAGDDH